MTQCLKKPPNRLMVTRSGVSLGKGSHKPSKRLVEPVNRIGQEGKRTYGFCTTGVSEVSDRRGGAGGVCCQRGAYARVPACARIGAAVSQPSETDPFPPAPGMCVVGDTRNFSPAFQGICKESVCSQLAA